MMKSKMQVVILLILLLTSGCSMEMTDSAGGTNEENNNDPKAASENKTTNATVTRVVDGDTLEVSMNGEKEDVRLLLIDTPETVHPDKPVEPFGKEASQFVKETLANEEVRIDIGKEKRDKYGRLLAYVFIDGETIQEKLLRKGLARTAYLYNDLTMLDEFHKVQAKAIEKGIGVWSIPGYAHKDHNHGYHYKEESGSTDEADNSSDSGTTDDTGTSDSVYYKNCTAVREAGADPIKRGDPGYDKHLDRDGDGIGCE
ncbi:thermonuclease family protein [Thalassobacillus pellis]|uniref:thermonuclease family protein n=1 Tax=Thalassobacillus pellis TaxID=748008 RepID=UPI001961A8ED|nr:thermonuclease family protein [Thalassobacillus pellis]MBM7553232.1 micrococcal nuclease [Thalassobacillus pellis]